MDALQAVFTRRSTRKYTDRLPDRKLIETIVEAGRYAPSGSNNQTTHFLVFTGRGLLNEMAKQVREVFAGMEIREDMYPAMKSAIRASREGNYVFHFHAPVLIVTANKKGYCNAVADSSCALENMMIAANASDLGSCWINQLHWLDENSRIREFLSRYGLKDDETITGGLALGYPEGGLPDRTPLERKGNPVTWNT